MTQFDILGRVETTDRGTYVARMWISPAGPREDTPTTASSVEVCNPSTLDRAQREFDKFVARTVLTLTAAGSGVRRIHFQAHR